MKQTRYYEVEFHYENIPRWLSKLVIDKFVQHRSEVVGIFNERINEANVSWKATEKPFAFGGYIEDINPEYVDHVKKRIQPAINAVNKRFYLCRYKLDQYGDIIGYVPFIPNSKVWITLKPLE